MTRLRLGVDVGGTFTDHILFDEDSGHIFTFKTPSTPEDPSQSVMAGVRHFDAAPRGLSGLWLMAHGTTVNTNTVLSRTGAKIGLITTRGFRDVLAIGRQTRPHFYRWDVDRPEPLAPRHLRLEVAERVDNRGEVVLPLCEEDVHRCVEVFRDQGVEAVAVCLLNSYANADHESCVKAILEEALPNVYLAVSSELSPEFREFERSSTVATVAYIGPSFQRYIDELERSLAQELAAPPQLYIMQSSGGMASAEVEMRRPHYTLESGPAAGVLASVDLGRHLDMSNIISFDMGGTTAKASLIQDGKPSIVSMLEIGKEATGFYGIRITGMPVRTPSIDLVECSAGGGSIAQVDVAGLLKVGPASAGADPGPACYGAGGTEPTVTDANVVLGRISPDFFLGGRMKIQPELSHRAIGEKIGIPLGMSPDEAAQGILDVVNANMVRILRVVSVSRGFDPRRFVLMAHGGAGPLHAGDLAEELGVGRIVIPPDPGLFSAMGLIISDVQTVASATRFLPADAANLSAIRESLDDQTAQCNKTLSEEGFVPKDQVVERFLEMRYVRQNFELEVPVNSNLRSEADLDDVLRTFHDMHLQSYGHSDPNAPVEVVNVKCRAAGLVPKPQRALLPSGSPDASDDFIGRRRVFFKGSGWLECPHYDRVKLLRDNLIRGPAMVCQFDSSVTILPGHVATVGPMGELVIDTGKGEAK